MTQANRLASARSPYLQQHAENPVDWWPWTDEALQIAREQNKLILLSIGYSACHWCHVMAHESFEDEATAAVMNEYFINIKVDREERPDLDRIYQTAHQLLNQRPGGWPLTVILTPQDHIPFFAGTYFPAEPKYDMPAFKELLQHVHTLFDEHPEQIQQQNDSLMQALASLEMPAGSPSPMNSAPIDLARKQLAGQFDKDHGGFAKAPKFPLPSTLEFLLRHWNATGLSGTADQDSRDMLQLTLQAMACGGLYDQLAGGFFRYAIDDAWMIPHFEKMLYDNGPLLGLYSQAATAFGQPLFRRVARQTAEWIIANMQSPQGGYYASLDADSEGAEGRYYVWTPQQIDTLLQCEQASWFKTVFGLDREANFKGHWHLHIVSDMDEAARQQGQDSATQLYTQCRNTLYKARKTRVAPARDEKILTSWNALMIKGMAQAGRQLNQPAFVESAMLATDFVRQHLFIDGRLLACYQDSQARIMGYLDDYAFLLDALLHVLQARWRNGDLQFACTLADALLEHFEDQQHGGFFFTAHDHEPLIMRPRPMSDEAIPAGNATAALALNRLGILLCEPRYTQAAARTLNHAWPYLNQAPYAHASLLFALEEQLYPPELIIIHDQPETASEWLAIIDQNYHARSMRFFIPAGTELPEVLQDKAADAVTGARACICQAGQSHVVVSKPEDILKFRQL